MSMPDAQSGLTTLGIASADDTGYAGGTFGGIAVSSGDSLILYTYAGDANLDGEINGDDCGFIDINTLVQGVPFAVSAPSSLSAVPRASRRRWRVRTLCRGVRHSPPSLLPMSSRPS